MLVTISGTPGTGKTKAAKIAAKQLGANLIEIKKLVDAGEIKYKKDFIRQTRIIDEKEMEKAVKKYIMPGKISIIESHMAHLLDSDITIILRTNPKILKERLKRKGWKRLKIRENLEAEISDAITIEALEKHSRSKVFEIDTSKKDAKVTARSITIILKRQPARYLAGRIDWSKYMKELI